MMMRTLSLVAAGLLACTGGFGQGNSSSAPPAAHAAQSLPQDRHEGMSVSADSYAESGRAKEKFGKANPVPFGILPVEVFLRNETPQPIHINLSAIQLEVHFQNGAHQELDALSVGEVADAVAHPKGPAAPQSRRFPIGIPSGAEKRADKLVDILQPLSLDADIVPPMATIHGFLFFNLSQEMSLAKDASLYVPEVTTLPANKPLMFFEVRLGPQ
ncbi:MAG TPA: hypothetical protein VJO53_03760 [Candidatus Acidoferrales bacterium]|nr:hypothetical protein [Candidatus Acidoferrales bacterium]